MTHSGGKEHAVGDKGQRYEVSFFNPSIDARMVYGWTDDNESALAMADNVEKHPSWQFPWVTDRQAVVPPNPNQTGRDIATYISNFFRRIEETPILPPEQEELVEGQAFTIKHYPVSPPRYVHEDDILNISILENRTKVAEVSEKINCNLKIDTISTLRFNDALGYKHAIGALFGQRNNRP